MAKYVLILTKSALVLTMTILLLYPTLSTAEPTYWYSDKGLSLNIGDDGWRQINIGFTFNFYGVDYTQCYVNANGNITFTNPDEDYTESVGEMLNFAPRIAPMWNDYKPQQTTIHNVYFNSSAEKLVVTWYRLVDYQTGQESTFQAVLWPDGTVGFGYDQMNTPDGISGLSAGNGTDADYTEYAGESIGDTNEFMQPDGSGGYEAAPGPPGEITPVESWLAY